MTTYRELVNLILDEIKAISDDSIILLEHVIFLLDKYRMFILKQRYSDIKKDIPQSNYLTICVDMELFNLYDNDSCSNETLIRSIQEIPYLVEISTPIVTTMDLFGTNISYVSNDRFKYVGTNKFLLNVIYSTIGSDLHLYIKSGNPQYKYISKLKVTGIFEDSSKAAALSCDGGDEDTACDTLDKNFPIEEALIPPMVELICKELLGVAWRPMDNLNNASDDLSDIMQYIRRNTKNDFQKALTGDNSLTT